MRAVLDTNIVVSALLWGGNPYKLIELATEGHLTLYTSPILLSELQAVLNRDHLACRLIQQRDDVENAIRRYAQMTSPVTPLSTPRVVPNDVDDDHVIACAIAAGTQLIVSGDSDLLVLQPWKGIQILNAADAVGFVVNAYTGT